MTDQVLNWLIMPVVVGAIVSIGTLIAARQIGRHSFAKTPGAPQKKAYREQTIKRGDKKSSGQPREENEGRAEPEG